jgi:hypothetical protein
MSIASVKSAASFRVKPVFGRRWSIDQIALRAGDLPQ